MKKTLFSICLLLLLASCDKDAKLAYAFAGTWDIQSIEMHHFSNNGNTLDSARTLNKPGSLVLFNMTDNTLITQYQYCRVTLPNEAPLSIVDFATRAKLKLPQFECLYSAGPHSNERLTIWKEFEIGYEYEIYTVKELTRKKMTLYFTRIDAEGFPAYQEIWELKIRD